MEDLKTLTLQVEILIGSDIQDVARDLCQLAERVGLMCKARFNGITLLVDQGDNPETLVANYHDAIKSAHPSRLATGR